MNAVRCFNETSKILVNAAVAGGLFGVAAWSYQLLPYATGWLANQAMPALHAATEGLVAAVNPLLWGSFAAIAAVVTQVVHPIFNDLIYNRGANDEAKFVGYVLECVVTSGLALSACWLFGFQATLGVKITLLATYAISNALLFH
jgi:hypothetical protein